MMCQIVKIYLPCGNKKNRSYGRRYFATIKDNKPCGGFEKNQSRRFSFEKIRFRGV